MREKEISVHDLRCEYQRNPLGIDEATPGFCWKIRGKSKGILQCAYRIRIWVEKEDHVLWDSGRVESPSSIHVLYQGPELKRCSRYIWQVKVWDQAGRESGWSPKGMWETGLMGQEGWHAAWIGDGTACTPEWHIPCSLYRREFTVKVQPVRARLYVTCLGLYEFYINGTKVGKDYFTPGWTDYPKRLQYQTYDITDMIREGLNAAGILLGNGWYAGSIVQKRPCGPYGNRLAVVAQIILEYADGTQDIIVTDGNWHTEYSAIKWSDIYEGEFYDSLAEHVGWNLPGYAETGWRKAQEYSIGFHNLYAQEAGAVQVMEEITPVRMLHTPDGNLVVDMGQNMVGYVSFKAGGRRGQKVTLSHGEILDQKGNLYRDNLRGEFQKDFYILSGGAPRVYRPHFTYHGFRYVCLEGWEEDPELSDFKGLVLHTAMEQTGSFCCSDQHINQLAHNILWSQKGNFFDIPTDCPQRNERLGWTGDAQVFIRTACYQMDSALFFRKWLRDLRSQQYEDGGVPYVIPQVFRPEKQSSAGWSDAAVICPWVLYLCYGDLRVLEEQYESMKGWVEYIRCQCGQTYLWESGFQYGDWLALDAGEGSYEGATSTVLIATAYYAYSTEIVSKAAHILGKKEESRKYKELSGHIRDAFREHFFQENGQLVRETQTGYVLTLMFDLCKKEEKERVAGHLLRLLKSKGMHLDTGFLGTPYLCMVLSDNGHDTEAYKLLMQKDYPSWLYQVLRGATTVWEHWDGIKEDGSFWSDKMNSFNHYAYGSVGEWLYRYVAGIDTDHREPGYRHILIRPRIDGSLEWAKATFETLYGRISSFWKREEGRVILKLEIPENTYATVTLSGRTEEVGSGSYEFVFEERDKEASDENKF